MSHMGRKITWKEEKYNFTEMQSCKYQTGMGVKSIYILLLTYMASQKSCAQFPHHPPPAVTTPPDIKNAAAKILKLYFFSRDYKCHDRERQISVGNDI